MPEYEISLEATSQRVVEITERLAQLLGVLRDVQESDDATNLALIDIARELADRAAVSGRAIRVALLACGPHDSAMRWADIVKCADAAASAELASDELARLRELCGLVRRLARPRPC